MTCSQGYGTLVGSSATEVRAFQAPCHRWECPDCGPTKIALLRHRLRNYKPNRFLTLTCNPAAYDTPAAAYKQMSQAFTKINKLLHRHFPNDTITYFLVWEKTRAGWPHLHILLSSPYIAKAFISYHWQRLTGAPIVYIRATKKNLYMRQYLTKYLTKHLNAPHRFKRYRASRAVLEPPRLHPQANQHPKLNWSYFWGTPTMLIPDLEDWGYVCTIHPDGSVTGYTLHLLNVLSSLHPPPRAPSPTP